MATNFGHQEATFLSNLVNSGALNKRTDVLEVVLAALRSSDFQWIVDVTKWVKVQDLGVQEEVIAKRKLFHEPTPRMLTGQIYTGETVPSGYKAMWPLTGFERGHMEISAASGGGKSTFANFIAPPIAQHVPVTVLDPLDQHHVVMPPNFGIFDFKDYRRNPFEPPYNMEGS